MNSPKNSETASLPLSIACSVSPTGVFLDKADIPDNTTDGYGIYLKHLRLNYKKLADEEKWLKKIAEKPDLLKNLNPHRERKYEQNKSTYIGGLTMKKKVLIALTIVLCIAAVCPYFFNSAPKGDTITSREHILNNAISKGNEWTIAKELELEGYIISGAYSTDHKSTLAVFEPAGDGNYIFKNSTNRNAEEIIISGAVINRAWYDLIWFNGAKTEYAEITYTINGQVKDTLKYDTDNMDIISIKNPEKEYSIHVIYYDKDGNKYE